MSPLFVLVGFGDCLNLHSLRANRAGAPRGQTSKSWNLNLFEGPMPRSLAWRTSPGKLTIVWGRGGSSGASCLVIRAQMRLVCDESQKPVLPT